MQCSMSNLDKFLENFEHSASSAPNPPLSPAYIRRFIFPLTRPKIKKFRNKVHFFQQIFSTIFQIFINFNAYFSKFSPKFRPLANSNISFRSSKIETTRHLVDPLSRKIPLKLLQSNERNSSWMRIACSLKKSACKMLKTYQNTSGFFKDIYSVL